MEKILLSLDEVEFANRSQLEKMHDLGSTRSANRLLKQLRDTEYILSFFYEQNVYYLSQKGREYIGSKKEVRKNLSQAEHKIMRTDIYTHFKPDSWEIERPIDFTYTEDNGGILIKKEKTVIPDVRFVFNGKYHLVEIDNLQSMKENEKKIEHYAALFPVFRKQMSEPVLVIYTKSDVRKGKWEQLCRSKNIAYVVLTPKDIF